MKNVIRFSAAAVLVASAGQAMGQATIDGSTAGDPYLAMPIWVQNQPTSFGDAVAGAPCTEDVSDAGNVTTGIEFSIPLATIPGYSAGQSIRIAGFLTSGGHDNISSQVIGGLPTPEGVGEPRSADFSSIAGDQFVTVSHTASGAATIDGALGADDYGMSLFTQTQPTTFGDNDDTSADRANGSEIDGVYAAQDGTNLYILVTGNLNTNFSKLNLFIDSGTASGQNQLSGENPDVDFNGLNRHGEAEVGVSGDGLIFDAGFTSDLFVTFTTGNDPTEVYANFAETLTVATDGSGDFIGGGAGTTISGGAGTLGEGAEIALDNSNIGGVTAVCPPEVGPDFSNGSELNGLWSFYDSDANTICLVFSGNLQTVGNQLNIFFDVEAGEGQNQVFGDGFNLNSDFGSLLRLGDGNVPNDATGVFTNGLTFDAGFDADYWMSVKTFDEFNPQIFINAAPLRTNGFIPNSNFFPLDYGGFSGGTKADAEPIDFDGPRLDDQTGFVLDLFTEFAPRTATTNTFETDPAIPPVAGLIQAALDNSNTGGVTDSDVSDAANVTTGFEICIDLDELGWDGESDLKVTAFISNTDNSFISNQIVGGLPDGEPPMPALVRGIAQIPADQLGEPRGLDLGDIEGDQFVVIPLEIGDTGPTCVPDITTDGANPGDADYLVPDGAVTVSDLSTFVEQWLAANLSVADITTDGANPGDADYLVPDSAVTVSDLSTFVELWLAGCP
ncbi:MAG: GC-type dockerin domain-anchored protein [Planctomycetota bacterium]